MDTGLKRISILGVPVDFFPEENLTAVIENMYTLQDHRQIIFLDFHELMRARKNAAHLNALNDAALIIPVSSPIIWAAKFLKLDVPSLQHSYEFIIKLLGILEQKNKSVYLLGSTVKAVIAAESTLRSTFPGLQIVGRHTAKFSEARAGDIIIAIKKAAPTLLLAGSKLKGKSFWISAHRKHFSPGLGIWEGRCFDVFSGQKSKPSASYFAHLFKSFFATLVCPWRFFRIFRYLFFFLLVLITRMRK